MMSPQISSISGSGRRKAAVAGQADVFWHLEFTGPLNAVSTRSGRSFAPFDSPRRPGNALAT
jgi:hypothetical protein